MQTGSASHESAASVKYAAIARSMHRVSPLDKQKGIQGSQFTTPRFTGILEGRQIRISMDRRGRWLDNVFIERLW